MDVNCVGANRSIQS